MISFEAFRSRGEPDQLADQVCGNVKEEMRRNPLGLEVVTTSIVLKVGSLGLNRLGEELGRMRVTCVFSATCIFFRDIYCSDRYEVDELLLLPLPTVTWFQPIGIKQFTLTSVYANGIQ